MSDFETIRSQLTAARRDEAAARRRLHRTREDLARIEQSLASLARRGDPDSDAFQAEKRELEARAGDLRKEVQSSRADLAGSRADLASVGGLFEPFADPRKNLGALDATVPVLLFPMRLETRFKRTADGAETDQLLVRVYPDDCVIDTFEAMLSEVELAAVRDFWLAWASAGGSDDHQRGAWRILAGDLGSGRAGWLVDQVRPLNLDTLPEKTDDDEVFLVIDVARPLPPAEVPVVAAFWEAMWRAGQGESAQAAARADLVAAVGEGRSDEIVAGYRPSNFDSEAVTPAAEVTVVFLELPDPDTISTQRQSWAAPATVDVLPERLVLVGYRNETQVLAQVGATIPNTLAVGLDPLAEQADQIHQEDGELVFGDDLAWLVDFDEAVRAGMGFRVDLSPTDLRAGFDQLMVLGVRLGCDLDEGKELVEKLFQHHQHGTAGFGLLATGTATNNTEDTSSGYGAGEDADETFDLTFGKAGPLTRTTDYMSRPDGQWLADTLGIDHQIFDKTFNSRNTSMGEARAMNTVLWPATWGYLMESMIAPVLDENTIAAARWFFTSFVTGRGIAPAIRIGDQPYGILPTTVFSRMAWLGEDEWQPPSPLEHPGGYRSFLARLADLLSEARNDWERMSEDVAFVGKAGDPHQMLLDIVGHNPASVEYHRRWAESLEQLSNRLKLTGLGGALAAAVIALAHADSGMQLLGRLGYAGNETPEILEKFFLNSAKRIAGNGVDDRKLSETNPLGAATPEGDNYIEWLIKASETSFDRLRKQEGFIDDERPRALLYLLLRYALEQGYWDASLRVLHDSGELTAGDVLAARVDPSFIHVAATAGHPELDERPARADVDGAFSGKPIHFDRASESRYDFLYRQVQGQEHRVIAELIPGLLGKAPSTRYLTDQLKALQHLRDLPTARLERAMAEHLDLAGYRLDAWRWGLLHYQLAALREGGGAGSTDQTVRHGLYVGAFGWLENVKSERDVRSPVSLDAELDSQFNPDCVEPAMTDSGNSGYVHAPSLNHAVTAAILRNGYLSNATPGNPDVLAVNLSSARVRAALGVLEGMRNGQSLGALLGYRLERGLHDRHTMAEVDRYIFELRGVFPLVANRLRDTEAPPGQPIETVEARNVVDGLALVEHVRDSGATEYPFAKPGLPAADAVQTAAINAEVGRLLDVYDAIADLATSEAVHQAVLGNAERTSATLDAFSVGSHPPQPEVVQTPRSGLSLTHRVGLHLESGLDGSVSPNPMPPTARSMAEPALNKWLGQVMPDPLAVTCTVEYLDPSGTQQTLAVSQQDLGLQPIDALYLIGTDVDQGMAELDDRIEDHVIGTQSLRPVISITIGYHTPSPGTVSFFEVGGLVRSLRKLVLRCRGLDATDISLTEESATDERPPTHVDPGRVQAPLDRLGQLTAGGAADDLTKLIAEMSPLLDDTEANHATLVAQAEGWSDRYLALARPALQFAIPQAALGLIVDDKRLAYEALLCSIDELLEGWDRRLGDYSTAVADAQALPTVEEQFEALHTAERLVTTEFSLTEPPTIAAYVTFLDGKRDQLAAKRAAFAAIRQNPPATIQAVSTAIAAELPLDGLDVVGIDLALPQTRLVSLARGVLAAAEALAAEVTGRTGTVSGLLVEAAATADPTAQSELRVRSAKALFGDDFALIPEFSLRPERADEIAAAWQDSDGLMGYLTEAPPSGLGVDFPVDDWLYGLARVRENMSLWEDVLIGAQALGTQEPTLMPLQLPYKAGDAWLGLEFPADYDHDGDRLAYTAHYATPFDKTAAQCGLLIDEWTEVIPTRQETTGVAFHYDRPNTEPPQTLLLALSPSMNGSWSWNDLVDGVRETFAEARLRGVEPAQVDLEAYSRFLPAAVMSTSLYPISVGLNLAMTAGVMQAIQED